MNYPDRILIDSEKRLGLWLGWVPGFYDTGFAGYYFRCSIHFYGTDLFTLDDCGKPPAVAKVWPTWIGRLFYPVETAVFSAAMQRILPDMRKKHPRFTVNAWREARKVLEEHSIEIPDPKRFGV